MAISEFTEPSILPEVLREQGLHLRSETAEDIAFLLALYCSVRLPELAMTNWPDEMKHQLLSSQFEIQRRQYTANYEGIQLLLILLHEERIGRIYLHPLASTIRIVDISLLPEFCGRRIGTALIQGICHRAARQGKTVSLSVEESNPALRLYTRLGFQITETRLPYFMMEWMP